MKGLVLALVAVAMPLVAGEAFGLDKPRVAQPGPRPDPAPATPPAPQPAPAHQGAAAPAPQQPQPIRTEIVSHDNWTVTCREFADKRKTCSGMLQVVQSQNNQIVFVWIVGKDPEGKMM